MTPETAGVDDEFVAAACEAVRRTPGTAGLSVLGWWDMLEAFDDHEARLAAFSLFRAQGRELGDSVAFGALLAHAYGVVGEPGSVAAAVTRTSSRRGDVVVLVGDLPTDRVLVDRPDRGASLVAVNDVTFTRVDVAGRLTVHEVGVDLTSAAVDIAEAEAATARSRSRRLGRVALSYEMLGAAEAALAMAVDHVTTREQFGTPIGTFQAVRHLLAWARCDSAAIASVAAQAVRLDAAAPSGFDEVLKALAGRNARRVCERSLQTFGGIGFTQEHDHHHFHSRVLALDALLGSTAELTRAIGARLRSSGADPAIATGLLLGASPR